MYVKLKLVGLSSSYLFLQLYLLYDLDIEFLSLLLFESLQTHERYTNTKGARLAF